MLGRVRDHATSLAEKYASLLLSTRHEVKLCDSREIIPLRFLSTWPWSLQVFDLAITAMWLSSRVEQDLLSEEDLPDLTSPASRTYENGESRADSISLAGQIVWSEELHLCHRLLLACADANPSSTRTLLEALTIMSARR